MLDTTSHLRGRPASRSSRYLGWKQFVAVVEQLVYVGAKSGFSRRKVQNKGGTTIGRRCLTLGDPGFMAGRGRVSRCSLPQRPAVSSHARLLGGARGGFVSLTQTAPASACPTTRPLEPLRLTEEAGKWPDQSGQSRLCRTLSEFVEVGEAIERRSPKENVTVTTS